MFYGLLVYGVSRHTILLCIPIVQEPSFNILINSGVTCMLIFRKVIYVRGLVLFKIFFITSLL